MWWRQSRTWSAAKKMMYSNRGDFPQFMTYKRFEATAATAAAKPFPAEESRWKLSREQVAVHNKEDDCWIIINGKVYDVTDFALVHPGRKRIFTNKGGDSTHLFEGVGHSYYAREMMKEFYIGDILTEQKHPRYELED